MSRLVLFFALVLGLCAVGSLPATAGDLVPFVGGFEGTVDHVYNGCSDGWHQANTVGNGVMGHLGVIDVVGTHCINGQGLIEDGTFTLTSADGALVHASYTGRVTDPNPERTEVMLTGVFTDGTGRFDGVTGSFTAIGIRSGGDFWHANLTFRAEGVMQVRGN